MNKCFVLGVSGMQLGIFRQSKKLFQLKFNYFVQPVRFKSLTRPPSINTKIRGSARVVSAGVTPEPGKTSDEKHQTGAIQNLANCARCFNYPKSMDKNHYTRAGATQAEPLTKIDNLSKQYKVNSLDHLVLTIQDLNKSIEFYTSALGMSSIKFGEGRQALQFGNQKINLHKAGQEFKPHAKRPTSGSADLCFVTDQPLEGWISKFNNIGIAIEEGPVKRTGAVGPMSSIYVRDPDENLVEIAFYG